MSHATDERTPDGTPILYGPDGLRELDNPMPRWMTVVYVGTIAFGVGYLLLMPGLGVNLLHWSQYKAYDHELAEAKEHYKTLGGSDLTALVAAAVTNPHEIAEGQSLFSANCAACHGAKGQGLIGPNLTDKTWLYGGQPGQIAHTISEGTSKGMPPWKTTFAPSQIAELAAFVHSLGGGQ
ncbi:MAG TPA: c-type cytochrome [Oscillatoriaceae cyanobacterium]